MLNKNIITKIALGIAAVAFVFSVITLIRAIVLGSGVLFAAIQVIGTMIIVSICAMMLYVLRTEDPEEEIKEEDDKSEETDLTDEANAENYEPEVEADQADKKEDKYDLLNFE